MDTQQRINIVLDATMLDTFIVCPAKYDMRFNKNKVQAEKAAPLDRGSLFHTGFEGYYKKLQETKNFEAAIDAAKLSYDHATIDTDLDSAAIRFYKSVMIENLTYWKEADSNYSIVAVEQPFSYELHCDDLIRLILIGKIDLLFSDDRYTNAPMDHKTFNRDGPVYRKTNQFCNYAYATQSNILLVNRVGLQTSVPIEKKYKRIPLSYDPLFLEQWKQNTIKWAYFYLDCAANNSWPLNDTSCDKYNRLCEYYDVCDSSGQDAKIYKLNADFKTAEKWDVSKALGLNEKKGEPTNGTT